MLGADGHRVGVVSLDRCPQILQQGHHGPHVADIGQVVQRDRFVGQQSGCQDGQGSVLVAAGYDGAVKGDSSLDDKSLHLFTPGVNYWDLACPGVRAGPEMPRR